MEELFKLWYTNNELDFIIDFISYELLIDKSIKPLIMESMDTAGIPAETQAYIWERVSEKQEGINTEDQKISDLEWLKSHNISDPGLSNLILKALDSTKPAIDHDLDNSQSINI